MPICSNARSEILTRALTVQPARLPGGNGGRDEALQKCQTLSDLWPTRRITAWFASSYAIGMGSLVGAEPGNAAVEATSYSASVVVENDVFPIGAAGQLSFGDFDRS